MLCGVLLQEAWELCHDIVFDDVDCVAYVACMVIPSRIWKDCMESSMDCMTTRCSWLELTEIFMKLGLS